MTEPSYQEQLSVDTVLLMVSVVGTALLGYVGYQATLFFVWLLSLLW